MQPLGTLKGSRQKKPETLNPGFRSSKAPRLGREPRAAARKKAVLGGFRVQGLGF